MISILILLVLAWTFYIGYSRGIVLQTYYSIAALVSFIVAQQFYQDFARLLSLWVPYASATQGAVTYFFPSQQLFKLDQVFYAGLAFLILFTFVYAIARFIGIFMHLIPSGFADSSWLKVASGVMAALVSLFAIEMFLTILATIPLSLIQDPLKNSGFASFIINHTPITSGLLKELWVTNIIG